MRNNFKINSKPLFILLSFIIALMCYRSFSTISASLNFYGARHFIEQWQSGGNVEYNDILKAEAYAKTANARHTDLALYSDTLSTVLQYKALHSENIALAATYLNDAEQLSLNATHKRPAWPVTWANLAYIKWLKGEFDDNFDTYLNNASLYGANTPEVHTAIASIGLTLPKQDVRAFLRNKLFVQKHTMAGLSHPQTKRAILTIIENTKTNSLVCAWLKDYQITPNKALKCV